MTFHKIAPLVTLAAHPNTPNAEARTSAFTACELIVKHALPVTGCRGDLKTLEKIQCLIERAAHAKTAVEEARTSAVIACRLITENEVRLLPVESRGPWYGPVSGAGSAFRRTSIHPIHAEDARRILDEFMSRFFGMTFPRGPLKKRPKAKPKAEEATPKPKRKRNKTQRKRKKKT